MAGSFFMLCKARFKFTGQGSHFWTISHKKPKNNYHIIFGQDLLQEVDRNLDLQNNFVGWKDTEIPMK